MNSLPIGLYPHGKFITFTCCKSLKEYSIVWGFETEINHRDVARIRKAGERVIVSAGFWNNDSCYGVEVLPYTSETMLHKFPPRPEDRDLITQAIGKGDHPAEE